MRRNIGTPLFLLALVLVLPACVATPDAASVPGGGRVASEVPAEMVPDDLGGYSVEEEDISDLEEEAGDDSYLASTRLWSLREGERLRATLQVGRLVPDAGVSDGKEDEDDDFRRRVVAQIGQTDPRLRVLGGDDVFVTVANDQPVYIWFRSRFMFILAVDKGIAEPRTLLRRALEVRA